MNSANSQPIPESAGSQNESRIPYVLPALGKPGDADCGRGVAEALDVITTMEGLGIPCCVVGAKALIYYGAHGVPMVSISSIVVLVRPR